MKEYKIYCLKNPETLEIRYIGVTTQKYISIRLSQHWKASKYNIQTRVCKWIRHINQKPIIELIEVCDENNWEEREKYWISYYDNLTNILPGGKGVVVNRSKNSIERSAESHFIKIVQIDDNGNLIKIWNSVKEATLFFKGKTLSSISNVLKNRSNRAFKYQWFYYNDYINNNYKIKQNKSTINYNNLEKIYMYDLNNNLIKEYKSKYSILKDLDCSYTSILKAINRKTPLLNKFYLKNYMI